MLTGGALGRLFRSPARAQAAKRANELFFGCGRGRVWHRRGWHRDGWLDRGWSEGSAHVVARADACVVKKARMRSATSGTTSGSRQPPMVSAFRITPPNSTDTPP